MPEIISGMFGVDPEQLRAQRMQRAYEQNMQMAQLDPAQRATAAWGNIGSGLFEMGARASGLQTPEERIATVRQEAFSQLDQSNPESFKQAALALNQAGDTRGAAMLVQAGREVAKGIETARIQSEKERIAQSEQERKDAEFEARRIAEERKFELMAQAIAAKEKSAQKEEKTLPPTVWKIKEEGEDSLSTAAQIKADTAAWNEKIKSGKLKLGLLTNVGGQIQVKAGVGGSDAVELMQFKSYLEQLRNDRLLLAKGTQTEGDAIRAMSEIVSTISDPAYVSARLDALGKNAQAKADHSTKKLKGLAKQYKIEDYDPTEYAKKESPYAMPKDVKSKKIVKTGTANGRKVVQYEDGSIEYAN